MAGHHEKMHKSHSAMCEHCKSMGEALGNESAKADSTVDLTKALTDSQTAISSEITAKLEPLTKALETLGGLAKGLETLQAEVEKIGKETIPTLVKGTGAQLIGRDPFDFRF